jgi:hypothetical protein
VVAGVLVVAAGILVGWYLNRARPGADDVGQHPALKPVLAELAGLPACGIRYRMHQRDSHEQVLLDQCRPIVTHPTPGRVALPAGYAVNDVPFQAKRDHEGEPWRLVVDKDRVPLERLVAALTRFAPILLHDSGAAIAEARRADEKMREYQRTHGDEADRARERSRSSYEK